MKLCVINCHLSEQLLLLPPSLFKDVRELDDIEAIVTGYLRDNRMCAGICDYSFGSNYGDVVGSSLKIMFCCQHGSSLGLGITLVRYSKGWGVEREWSESHRFCPLCDVFSLDSDHPCVIPISN